MLKSLYVSNYALISLLELNLSKGLTTVTGETGAGKSIILGALGLIIGQRADRNILANQEEKCIVEATFDIADYKLESFFEDNNLDYDPQTIIRREINSNGKSRAFINDSPTALETIRDLSLQLIDIHSQHENLALSKSVYQLNIVDSLADNEEYLTQYKSYFKKFSDLKNSLAELLNILDKEKKELDFISFQYKQLDDAKLIEGEQEELEDELKSLSHIEEIKSSFTYINSILEGDESNIILKVKELRESIHKLNSIYPKSDDIYKRFDSIYIELKDCSSIIEQWSDKLEQNPERLQWIRDRLDLIYSLQQVHKVSNIKALITIKDHYAQRITVIETSDEQLEKIKEEITQTESILYEIADKLHQRRFEIAKYLSNELTNLLQPLSMPHASCLIDVSKLETLGINGQNKIRFLFSANKNSPPLEIADTASGGELSRFMLSLKYIISKKMQLPTIIFDEIDSGVSGETADKMGNMIREMSKKMQVLNITHLPQIAAKGNQHLLVYKEYKEHSTQTNIRLLNEDERLMAIAKMLSGEIVTNSAIEHAKELLQKTN